ncbi:tyrosine-type recombinase/integrase [Spirillospora sp. CA-108201]
MAVLDGKSAPAGVPRDARCAPASGRDSQQQTWVTVDLSGRSGHLTGATWLLPAMEAGLPPVRLHDLRHGAATILLRAGHDLKVVQETLGLSSITIASDTYTSVLPDLARQSAEDAAAVILNARTQPGRTAASGRVVHLPEASRR